MSCCKYYGDLTCENLHLCDDCEVQAKWKENEKRDFGMFTIGRLAYNKEGKRFIRGCYYCGATLQPETADCESWVCPQCGYRTKTEFLVMLYDMNHHRREKE